MKNRFTALLFYTAGVVMLTLAYEEYVSPASTVYQLFRGALPEKILLLLAGGGVCTVIGLITILSPRKK